MTVYLNKTSQARKAAELLYDAMPTPANLKILQDAGKAEMAEVLARFDARQAAAKEAEPEAVTHLSGPYSTGCSDVEPQDMFTHSKASVDCDGCLSAIEAAVELNTDKRYVVDYDEERATWGTWDRLAFKFVGHTTTLTGARVQARKMNQHDDV